MSQENFIDSVVNTVKEHPAESTGALLGLAAGAYASRITFALADGIGSLNYRSSREISSIERADQQVTEAAKEILRQTRAEIAPGQVIPEDRVLNKAELTRVNEIASDVKSRYGVGGPMGGLAVPRMYWEGTVDGFGIPKSALSQVLSEANIYKRNIASDLTHQVLSKKLASSVALATIGLTGLAGAKVGEFVDSFIPKKN